METNSGTNLTKLKYSLDLYYSHLKQSLINSNSNNKNKTLNHSPSTLFKTTFKSYINQFIFDEKKRNFIYNIPFGLFYLNIYNIGYIFKKQIFYENGSVHETLTKLFKIDFNKLSLNIADFFKYMLTATKNVVLTNFKPFTLINRSMIYSISFFPFIYINYQTKGDPGMINYAYLALMSIFTIPFVYAEEKYNLKKYVQLRKKVSLLQCFKPNLNRDFYLICLKSVFENFGVLWVFFKVFNLMTGGLRSDVKNLMNSDKRDILMETINDNDTFKRVEMLYMDENEPFGLGIDYTYPVIFASFIAGAVFSPFDYVIRFVIYNKCEFRDIVRFINGGNISSGSSGNSGSSGSSGGFMGTVVDNSRSAMVTRFRYLFFTNLFKYFFQYGLGVFAYYNFVFKERM